MYVKNDNLIIRNATTDDAQILWNWWSDGKVMAHAGFPNGVYTDIDGLIGNLKEENDNGRRLIIEIDAKPVGEMSYRNKGNVSEIGIKICDSSCQEMGYGTKAIKMLISYLFDELKVEKIILDTNLENTRAQHVYNKIGFKKVAVRINSWKNQLGVSQSSVDYELIKAEWNALY